MVEVFYSIMKQIFPVLFAIGIVFGLLGAFVAYLITYREWVHHYTTTKIPRKMALNTAVFTFIFFVVIALQVGLFV
jgi:uncharacterized membrane protein